jgi:Ca-activated chloride channel family protein
MNPDLQGLNLVELIDLLEPAPEPAPISMMPQTVGWVWFGLALALLVGWLIRRAIQHRQANAYRRAALGALAKAEDDPACIADILRRTALSGFPRGEVAGLTGKDWLHFLDQTMGDDRFSNGPGRIVPQAPYRPAPTSPELTRLAHDWIVTHKQPKQEV